MRLTMRWTITAGVAGILFCYAGGGGTQPVLAVGSEAEITGEGLHRVDREIMDAAWVRPDLNLGRYKKILFRPAVVSFREIRGGKYWARYRSEEEFPVSDQNSELFRIPFGETFYE